MFDFLIVGAGISGCLAAKKLSEASQNVLVIEKSRGAGGRMSSRRVDSPCGQWRFDHGAQFFTARDCRFQALIEESSVCRPWHERIPHLAHSQTKVSKRWIGREGMSSLAKEWSKDLKIHFQERVLKSQVDESCWKVFTDKNIDYQAKHLVLSCPIPQSLLLLPPNVFVPEALTRFSYEACWTVLLGAKEEFRLESPHALWLDPGSGIDWICDNQKKGVSELPALTIQLTAKKTHEFLNASSDEVIHFVKKTIYDFLPDRLEYEASHRWLYATPQDAKSHDRFYSSTSPAPFSIIGDAFLGGRVEGAVLSALSFVEDRLSRES
jgi:predicted NAD/FAD-dependent oxidoreductase